MIEAGTSLMFLGVQGAQVADPLIEARKRISRPYELVVALSEPRDDNTTS